MNSPVRPSGTLRSGAYQKDDEPNLVINTLAILDG
jgi:hypothetical protein